MLTQGDLQKIEDMKLGGQIKLTLLEYLDIEISQTKKEEILTHFAELAEMINRDKQKFGEITDGIGYIIDEDKAKLSSASEEKLVLLEQELSELIDTEEKIEKIKQYISNQ